MRIIAWTIAIGTLVTAAAFTVVSLNRWEWNRALFFALIVLIAEVGIATGLVLRRLGPRDLVDPAVIEALREARPQPPRRFRWLEDSVRGLNVFITLLVAGGILLSSMAWLTDKVAARTSTRAGEDRLARELRTIAYPSGGLLVDEVTALAQHVPGADDTQIRMLLRRTTPDR
jgi:hypothetical protein